VKVWLELVLSVFLGNCFYWHKHHSASHSPLPMQLEQTLLLTYNKEQCTLLTEADHMRSRLLRQTAKMPMSFLTGWTHRETVVLLSASLLPLYNHNEISSQQQQQQYM